MAMADTRTLTLGEAARRLGTTVGALLERIYRGEVSAIPDRERTRLLLDERDVDRMVQLQADHQTG